MNEPPPIPAKTHHHGDTAAGVDLNNTTDSYPPAEEFGIAEISSGADPESMRRIVEPESDSRDVVYNYSEANNPHPPLSQADVPAGFQLGVRVRCQQYTCDGTIRSVAA